MGVDQPNKSKSTLNIKVYFNANVYIISMINF